MELDVCDTRCFINDDSQIIFVKDLKPGSYIITNKNNYVAIELLVDECGDIWVDAEYVLYDSLKELEHAVYGK